LSDDDGERDKHPHAPIVPISQTTGETVHAPIVEEYEETMIVEKILSKRVRDVKVNTLHLVIIEYEMLID